MVSSLTRSEVGKLIELNERMTERLLEGVSVSGLPDWDQGRSQRVQFIDLDHPERNDFLAINQFRVDEPGGQAKKFVAPDVVLFVNGIPLVVIECKSPYVTDPMAEGDRPAAPLRQPARARHAPRATSSCSGPTSSSSRPTVTRRGSRTFTAGPRALPRVEGRRAALAR